ncbi:MAG: hypothetical protein HZB54_02605 [Deltaproteobacteria bacterium]|nr:hypothetical protein [Deltaproteobacteria bacterium]
MPFSKEHINTENKIRLMVLVLLSLFIYGLYNIFQPDRFPMKFVRGEIKEINENIIVGPYPTEREIIKLKKMGVNEIINLMDSTSVIESSLIDEGKKLAEKYNLKYTSFPMSFTKLGSAENNNQISLLIKHILSAKGSKLYIHCYLGRHRVALLEKELTKIK